MGAFVTKKGQLQVVEIPRSEKKRRSEGREGKVELTVWNEMHRDASRILPSTQNPTSGPRQAKMPI